VRVAILCINYAPSVGGAQELARRIGEGLVGAGHEVRVVTTDTMLAPASPDAGRLPVGVEVMGGVEVHRLPVARRSQDLLRAGRRLGARLGRRIRPTVLAYGPWGRRLWSAALDATGWADVVVATSAPFTTIPAAVRAGRRTATPVVSVPLLHLDDWTPGRSVLEPLRNSARAVALTSSEHDWMVRAGVDGRRCVVLPPGVDPVTGVPPPPDAAAARARLGIDDRPTVAVIGRIAATKGIDTLLAAAPEILRACPEAQFLVAGRRTGWTGLDELVAAASPEVADRVVVRRGRRGRVPVP
jgi:glycosyltransferase involved in cell wall biosynthesis